MIEKTSAPQTSVGDVLDEYLKAVAAGAAPDREALLAKHPEVAEDLAAALVGLDFVEGAAPSLTGTVAAEADGARTLGDFRLLREIGRGGMAVVYEAEQVSLGRRVALKVLPFAAVLDPKALQRFKHEAMAAAHLRHSNIVPVHAVGCERGVHYYAMQYVEGQSLAGAIREMKGGGAGEKSKTPISSHGSHRERAYVRMAATIGAQAAEALDHAHQLGIVHRDVKPANLLVDTAGTLWITDFGLASSRTDAGLTVTGELLGTIRYMSPEQALAKRVPVDHRTDIYSLGATLYELLTLEPAFPGEDAHLVIKDIAVKEPAPPRRLNAALPRDLETIVLKAMAKDPASRYATAQEMADDLRRCLDDKPVLARRPSLPARVAKWSRRHRGLVAAGLAVVLVGSASLAVGAKTEERNTRAALVRAQENLRLAREATDKFLVQTGMAGFEDVPLRSPARRELLESALRFYERNVDDATSTARASILHALHRYPESLAAFEVALAAAGEQSSLLVMKGHLLDHLGRHDEALVVCTRAVELDQKNAQAHYIRGTVLAELDRHADALAECDTAIRLDDTQARFHLSRGTALGRLDRTEDSLKAFRQVIELEPTLSNGHHRLGLALLGLGKTTEALAAFEKGLIVNPNSAELHYGRGSVLLTQGHPKDALAAFERAIEIDPELAGAFNSKGNALQDLGELDRAVEAYDAAIRLEKNNSQFHDSRGNALARLHRESEALAAFQESVRLNPDGYSAYYNQGVALLNASRSLEAIPPFQRSIALRSDFPDSHVSLGNAYANTGNPQGAIREYRLATDLAKDHAEAWGGLGNLLRDTGDYEEAAKAYREVARIRPEYAAAPACLGHVLENSGKIDEAIVAYRAALALQDDFPDVHRMLGRALRQKELLVESIAEYRKAIAQRSGFAEAKAELGRTLNEHGEPDAAIEACRDALRDQHDLVIAYVNLGVAWLSKGDPAQAIAAYRDGLSLVDSVVRAEKVPTTGRALHEARLAAVLFTDLAQAYAKQEKDDEAKKALKEAIRLDRNLSRAHRLLAWLLFQQRDDEEAIHEYREALRTEPEDHVAHAGLGRALLTRKRFAEALVALRRANELGSKYGNWDHRSVEEDIAAARRGAELSAFLDQVLAGQAKPKDARQRVEFARLLLWRKDAAGAARMYESAFAEEPALGEDLANADRYNAACAALLAAAMQGEDGEAWRSRALGWLKTDLAAREKTADARSFLEHAKVDADLASVRDRLDDLPAPEREAWRALWAEVDRLLDAPKPR